MKKYILTLVTLTVAAVLFVTLYQPLTVHASRDIVSLSVEYNHQYAPGELSEWTIKFESSGTHIKDGYLKIRLDFYPSEGSKCYDQQYVYVVDEKSPEFLEGYKGELDKEGNPVYPDDFQKWLDGLPHIWRVNPALCHFITVPPDITTTDLDNIIKSYFDADVVATIDDAMSRTDSAHLISPYMADKAVLTTAKVADGQDEKTLIDAVNSRLSDFQAVGEGDGTAQPLQGQSIDVGPGAINRDSSGSFQTYVSKTNTANAAGTLDTWELWFSNSGTNVEVATFYVVSGNNLSTRDTETIGSVTSGSKQTFTGKSTDVSTGDYAGEYHSGGSIEMSAYDGQGNPNGYWYKSGDNVPCTNTTFNSAVGTKDISIYATGTESGGEPDISVSPDNYDFGVVSAGSTPSTSTSYFTIDNLSTMQTDQTISVTASTWSGGSGWSHSDICTPDTDTAGLKANRGGTWGTGDVIVKYSSPNYIYENCPAATDYSFGLKLWAPTGYYETGVLTIEGLMPCQSRNIELSYTWYEDAADIPIKRLLHDGEISSISISSDLPADNLQVVSYDRISNSLKIRGFSPVDTRIATITYIPDMEIIISLDEEWPSDNYMNITRDAKEWISLPERITIPPEAIVPFYISIQTPEGIEMPEKWVVWILLTPQGYNYGPGINIAEPQYRVPLRVNMR